MWRVIGRSRLLKIVLPILVLVAAVLVAGYLRATRPELAPSALEERAWPVATMPARIADIQPDLTVFGGIVAQRDVELRALVSGTVIEVGDGFVEGGLLGANDLLVAIDPFDYEAALDERGAELDEARARLTEIAAQHEAEDRALEFAHEQLVLSEREEKRRSRLVTSEVLSQKALDDARMALSEHRQAVSLREHNVAAFTARTRQQRAVIERLGVALRRAERDLTNTLLVAPFGGLLVDTNAAIGKRLAINDRVARLVDLTRLEAKFHLSDDEFGRLIDAEGGLTGRSAEVTWWAGTRAFAFRATIDRIGGEIDPTSGGVDLFARIEGLEADSPLRPGAFVEIRVPDRLYRGVVRLPEASVHGGDTVYAVVGVRLEARRVEVVARIGDDVLLQGEFVADEPIVITRFAEIGPGVRVIVR